MHLQAVMTYSPYEAGNGFPIPIGRTDNPAVLRTIRDCLLAEAQHREELWKTADPVVAALMKAEVDRLEHVLSNLMPKGGPGLRLVEGSENGSANGAT
jgi:hypothetical protein